MSRIPTPVLVFLGGTLGGLARLLIDAAVPHAAATVPWDLIAINVAGASALGALVARSQANVGTPMLPLVGTGMLGGFTTFSAIAVLATASSLGPAQAALWLMVTTTAAVAGAALGWRFAMRQGPS